MKKLHFILLLFCSSFCYGQINIDSLFGIWENINLDAPTRFSAVKAILSTDFHYSQPEKSLALAKAAYDFAAKENLKMEMATAKYFMGRNSSLLGEYENATTYLEEAIITFEQLNEEKELAESFNSLGNVYIYQSDYANAIKYYQKSLLIAEKMGDPRIIGGVKNNIGLIYMDMEDPENALKYLNESLNMSIKIGSPIGQSNRLNNIGTIYRNQKEYKKAYKNYKQSLAILEKENSEIGLATCLNNLGIVYEEFGDTQKALSFFQRSIDVHKKFGNKKGIANSLFHFGTIYKAINQDSALIFGKEALQLAQEIGSTEEISDAAGLLSQIYQDQGQDKLAIEMNQIYHEAKDSIFSIRNQKAILINEFKAKQDELLSEYNSKYKSELENNRSSFQRQKLLYLFGLILILLISGYFFYSRRKQNLKEKEELLLKIERLKKNLAVQTISFGEEKTTLVLDKEKIEQSINTKLGESSWMILNLLLNKPSISNKEIAKEVSLSVEGVSSSLRRMYSSFKISSSSNKKIALITKAIRISTEK